MIDVVQKKFADFSGAPYDDERVRIAIDEGRNYIASRDRLYDIIKISVTDTWTASALGAYALTENYRYTVQAIMDFVSHLEPGGYLSIIRWYPQESLRLVALSATALRELGCTDPYVQMVMARGPKTLNLTIKNGVFERTEVETLEEAVRASGLTWVGGGEPQADLEQPARSPANDVDDYHRLAAWSPASDSIALAVPFSIVPPTDDRPFFFSPVTLRAATTGEHYSFGSFTFQHGRALVLVTGLFKVSMALALLFVIGPLLLRGSSHLRGHGGLVFDAHQQWHRELAGGALEAEHARLPEALLHWAARCAPGRDHGAPAGTQCNDRTPVRSSCAHCNHGHRAGRPAPGHSVPTGDPRPARECSRTCALGLGHQRCSLRRRPGDRHDPRCLLRFLDRSLSGRGLLPRCWRGPASHLTVLS